MKTTGKMIISAVSLAAVFTGNCFSQNGTDSLVNKSGIYVTADDFIKGKMTNEVDCAKEKNHLKMRSFLSQPTIDFSCNGKICTYRKKEIFGVRDCDNAVYRFYNNKEYQIVEAGSIYIYTREHAIYEGRGGVDIIIFYFYSIKPDGEIKDLTISNIEETFPNNPQLKAMLATECSRYRECSEEDISTYDNIHKMYKINYLLSQLH